MKTIVVLGMHRSGTSAVAGMLFRLGASVGDESDLLPPAEDNPRGFYEHRELKAINDGILAEMGGSWREPPFLPDGWVRHASMEPLRARGRQFIDELATAGQTIVLKDPRLCLTLPFWHTVTPIHHVVATLRGPTEVAGSLMVRNGLAADEAVRLWTRYVADALAHAQADHQVHFDELLDDPVGVARRLAPLVRTGELDEAEDTAVQEFVDRSLRHQEDAEVPPSPTLALAQWLHDLMVDDLPRARTFAIGLASVWHDSSSGPIRRVQEVHEELSGARQERTQLAERLADARDERSRLAERLAVADTDVAFLDARSRRLRHDLTESDVDVRTLRRQVRDARGKQEAAERDAALLEERLEGELHARDQRVGELSRRLDTQGAQLRRARDAQRDLDRLRNRRTVRAALALARWARPLFRVVRRARRRSAPASQGAAAAPRGPDTTMAATGPRSKEMGPVLTHRPEDAAPILHLDWDRTEEWDATPRPSSTSQPGEVTIVVPVHGGGQVVARCLQALWEHTSSPARVCLVDDASPDDETRQLLREAARRPGVDLIVNDHNLGFTRSVNLGFAHATGDVVVLNSDTQVGPRWLQRLQQAAYASSSTGSATAVSDDAGAFSVPVPGRQRDIPAHLDPAAAARLVAQTATPQLPAAPTGNGFCWYVKRAMLDEVGYFDDAAFPRGYGEENDLSMRARRAGWGHVVEPGTFVRHLRGTSFGEQERTDLMARGRAVLDERYPEYTSLVGEWMRSEPMARLHDRVARVWATPDLAPAGLPAVLYVLQSGRGGSPAAALDLATAMAGRYSCLMLSCDARVLRLHRVVDGDVQLIESHELYRPIRFSEPHRSDVRQVLESIMVRHAIELVHVRHFVKQTLDAPEVAASLGIPYVVSLHDFYLVCPTINLLDEKGRYCAGVCTEGPGPCPIAMRWIDQDAGHLKHDGVHEWRETVRPLLEGADGLVTTSSSARDVFANAFGEAAIERMRVIEHGRDLPRISIASPVPAPQRPVRVLVPGNLDTHKGAQLIAEMREAPGGDRLEFHFLGHVPERFAALGVDHGTYERAEFADRVGDIAPHFIGVLSTCAETYCHALSEAWMTDVPVVTTDIGALGERARAHGGALLVPHDEAAEACRRILELADDPDRYESLRRPDDDAVRPTSAMALDYDLLYREVLDARRVFPAPPVDAAGTPDGAARSPRRVGLVALGDERRSPGSVHVRTLRRLSHPVAARHLVSRRVGVGEVIRGSADVDVVLVQRTAVPADDVEPFLRAIDEHGYGLVVEVDDLLWDEDHLPSGDADWRPHVLGLRQLLRRADLVTVSTPYLKELAEGLADRVEVVPNDLDERLWLAPLASGRRTLARPGSDTVRILYMGTRTHADDLALLDPVLERLDAAAPGDWDLTVVGGEPARASAPDWYHHVHPPREVRDYRSFVPWIRQLARDHDVAVAPLVDSRFAQAKSDLKWLEYTAMGLPVVLSDVGPYAASVDDGDTGLLVPDAPQAWVEALRLLRDDGRLRGRLRQQATAHLQAHRLLRHSIHDWVALVESVPVRRAGHQRVPA